MINLEFSHKKMIKRLWDEIWSIIEERFKEDFEIQEHVDFNEAEDTKNPEIILRLYENHEYNMKKGETDSLNFLSKK